VSGLSPWILGLVCLLLPFGLALSVSTVEIETVSIMLPFEPMPEDMGTRRLPGEKSEVHVMRAVCYARETLDLLQPSEAVDDGRLFLASRSDA